MDFHEYLIKKNIDPAKFEKGDPDRWADFKNLYEQVHPASFTAQKLYLINRIRRQFPLTKVL
ncbi:hypothetical protein BH23BAC1_BH23BAC1_31340 [soil metagenome]|jgi:hypothetical protein